MEFFYYEQLASHPILTKSYNAYLVTLSIVIAIISAFAAFGIAERISASKNKLHQSLWILFGATTLGAGVWSMHFIGILALILPIPVSYNASITLISLFPVIITTSLVLWLKSRTTLIGKRLWFCGILLGSGIGLMHYIGMEAMELNAGMFHIKWIFFLSILVAILLATLALKIQTNASQQIIYHFIDKKQIHSAIIMGLAISAMHYIAMQATVFIQIPNTQVLTINTNTALLTMMISIVIGLSLLLTLIIPIMVRYLNISEILLKNEENLRIAATAFQTNESIMITDANANIIRVNEAFVKTTGFTEKEVLGKNPRILSSDQHDKEFYTVMWKTIIETGNWSGEIWNRRKNGEIYPEWQTISVVKDTNGNITHYISFFSDMTEYKKSKKQVEELAYYDPLTNLPNRRLLYECLEHELTIAKLYKRIGAVLFMDLDRFKNINDSLGHSVGDALLIEVSYRLQTILDNSAIAIRLGGDEFIILIPAQDNTETDVETKATLISELIINQINLPYFIAEHDLYISTSIGISLYTGEDNNVDIILKRADTAMYYAKDAGRNTYRFYQQRMQEVADARLNLEKNLRKAIEKNEFKLYYQPQCSSTGEIIGAEALIRWKQSEIGMIPPSIFIPIAEESDLIIDIGNWVINSVCQQIKRWDEQHIYIPHIAINISANQFHQPNFALSIINILKKHQVNPERVLLEITEGVFLKNLEEAINKMNILRDYGFNFSIDDFGTGYSSLSYLRRLPFDQLKIDQSFIHDIMTNQHCSAIVQAIIVMAEGLELTLIAEGVENNKQVNHLFNYGCQYFQGYYFSKPLTTEKFAQYILEKNKKTN